MRRSSACQILKDEVTSHVRSLLGAVPDVQVHLRTNKVNLSFYFSLPLEECAEERC